MGEPHRQALNMCAIPEENAVACLICLGNGENRSVVIRNAVPENGIISITHFANDIRMAIALQLMLGEMGIWQAETVTNGSISGPLPPTIAIEHAAIIDEMERFPNVGHLVITNGEKAAALEVYRSLTANGFRRNENIINAAVAELAAVNNGDAVVANAADGDAVVANAANGDAEASSDEGEK